MTTDQTSTTMTNTHKEMETARTIATTVKRLLLHPTPRSNKQAKNNEELLTRTRNANYVECMDMTV